MGYAHQHHNLGPSIDEYFANQFVMTWNLCGDGCVGGHDHVPEVGSLDLRLNLNQPADNLELLIMGVFENCLTVEKGVPEIDYST